MEGFLLYKRPAEHSRGLLLGERGVQDVTLSKGCSSIFPVTIIRETPFRARHIHKGTAKFQHGFHKIS